MNNAITIRSYEPHRDENQVYTLWQQTIGHHWPLSLETFHYTTVANPAYQQGDHFVAQIDQDVVGFLATQGPRIPGLLPVRAELMLILVTPAYQKQGIGRALLDRALAALKQRGVEEVQLGDSGLTYFWPGVPTNLPGAWPFFQACGWADSGRSFDLARKLYDYVTPPGIYERLRLPGITIGTATQADVSAVLEFEARHFPRWLPYYQRVMDHNGYADVVVAKDPHHGIVGTSSVLHSHASWQRHDIPWRQLLGENTGGIGPLGVAESMRENGIGLALAARVTELLQERGIKTSYIGYTWLLNWYGKLGYQLWRDYTMSWKKL
jgi:GNAT superfamily N-acetyltransferase